VEIRVIEMLVVVFGACIIFICVLRGDDGSRVRMDGLELLRLGVSAGRLDINLRHGPVSRIPHMLRHCIDRLDLIGLGSCI
jgi:hypothetical protein